MGAFGPRGRAGRDGARRERPQGPEVRLPLDSPSPAGTELAFQGRAGMQGQGWSRPAAVSGLCWGRGCSGHSSALSQCRSQAQSGLQRRNRPDGNGMSSQAWLSPAPAAPALSFPNPHPASPHCQEMPGARAQSLRLCLGSHRSGKWVFPESMEVLSIPRSGQEPGWQEPAVPEAWDAPAMQMKQSQ